MLPKIITLEESIRECVKKIPIDFSSVDNVIILSHRITEDFFEHNGRFVVVEGDASREDMSYMCEVGLSLLLMEYLAEKKLQDEVDILNFSFCKRCMNFSYPLKKDKECDTCALPRDTKETVHTFSPEEYNDLESFYHFMDTVNLLNSFDFKIKEISKDQKITVFFEHPSDRKRTLNMSRIIAI